MTFGSLFSGIGGLDLGLERAGMECRWQVESDPYCSRVLAKHWPGVKRYEDIKTIDGSELEPVDCIAGGFPCQDISSAGKRRGIEVDTRSGLWAEMWRIIRVVLPGVVLVENVSALLDRMDGGVGVSPIQRVLCDLAEIGYDSEWDCIPTGLSRGHRRDRVFIIAYPLREGLSPSGGCEPSAHKARCLYVDSATPSFLRAQPAPRVVRNVLGIPSRMDRIVSIGNSVSPDAAKWIGCRIIEASMKADHASEG